MPYRPTIPNEIVVHLGAPDDASAQNVSMSFPDYIKNVASSEIFPSWPDAALRANILAEISVALNRIYTGYYRNSGYNFDITSSPAYDQTFVYQREIYSNIASIVDEIFDSYVRRADNIEPLFTEFCDGIEVSCNGLSQWGSVTLAEEGLDYLSILKNYYGDDIVIETNVPVGDRPAEIPNVTLREGDSGADIEILQRRLNRISTNFPGIPKISPQDGYFGSSTTEAVREFQKVFGLTEDGLVGRATWNQVSFVYNAVKRLSEVNSEGLTLADVTTDFTRELKEGDSGEGVLAVQYYLEYISRFVPTIQPTQLDGSYGPSTENAVVSFQKTYGLAQTGIVDRLTWDRMENVYYTYVNELDYASNPPVVLPYPGRLIAQGVEGNDVRVLQRYLNTIADVYTEIPKVSEDGIYGNATIAQVKKFREIFGIENESDRVGAATWNAIASVYEDITVGRMVNEGQYPGYRIS